MLRTALMIAAAGLICFPLGGAIPLEAHGANLPEPLPLHPTGVCWLGARQLALIAACLFVLALAVNLVRPERQPARLR